MDGGTAPGVVEEGGVAEIARGKFRDPGLGSRRTRGEGPRSVRPTTAPEGARWFEGKERRALPLLVPPTVVEDLTI